MTKLRLAGIGVGIAAALTIGGCTDYARGYGSSGSYQNGYGQPPQGGYDQRGYADGSGYDEGNDNGGYDQGGYDQGGYGGGYAGGGYYQGGGGYYGGYDGFADGPDYGYGYGWYNDFYYPGFGVFIYDRGGHRHPWRSGDRDYWSHHPRPHGDNPPRPGQGSWRGPTVPSRGGGHVPPAGTSAPTEAQGRWRGYDRGAQGGNPPPAYIRRPMTQEQRIEQQQNAPGTVPMRGGRGYRQNQAPQGRAFQAAPGAPPQVQSQPAVAAPAVQAERQAPRARYAVPARGGRGQPGSGDGERGGGHHHHDD